MIDIIEKGKNSIEVLMHFVNKALNPTLRPEIKKYKMELDIQTQEFLQYLDKEVAERSIYYAKVAEANAAGLIP